MFMKMSVKEVMVVKRMLCEGFSQMDVARQVGVSGAHVNRICLGDAHRDVPWPDEAMGRAFMRERTVRDGFLKTKTSAFKDINHPSFETRSDHMEEIKAQQAAIEEAHPGIYDEREEKVSEKDAQAMALMGAEMASHDPEDGESGQLKNIRAAIAMVHEKREENYLAMATKIDETAVRVDAPPPPSIWTAAFLEWDHLLKVVPHNSIVQSIPEDVRSEGENEVMKRAIGIVFKHTKEEEWESDNVIKMISSTVINLRKSPQSPK